MGSNNFLLELIICRCCFDYTGISFTIGKFYEAENLKKEINTLSQEEPSKWLWIFLVFCVVFCFHF